MFPIFRFSFYSSGAEIGRFVSMLRNPYSILKACAAFALLQVDDYSLPLMFLGTRGKTD